VHVDPKNFDEGNNKQIAIIYLSLPIAEEKKKDEPGEEIAKYLGSDLGTQGQQRQAKESEREKNKRIAFALNR